MAKYNPTTNVLNARNAAIAAGEAADGALILWAATMAADGYDAAKVDAEVAAYTANGRRLSYVPAIKRIALGKADGNKAAGNPHEYAYASAGKARAKAKATAGKAKAAKGKATPAKADAPKGNPLKGVAAAQVMAWLVDAGTLKAVAAEIDAMRKAIG